MEKSVGIDGRVHYDDIDVSMLSSGGVPQGDASKGA